MRKSLFRSFFVGWILMVSMIAAQRTASNQALSTGLQNPTNLQYLTCDLYIKDLCLLFAGDIVQKPICGYSLKVGWADLNSICDFCDNRNGLYYVQKSCFCKEETCKPGTFCTANRICQPYQFVVAAVTVNSNIKTSETVVFIRTGSDDSPLSNLALNRNFVMIQAITPLASSTAPNTKLIRPTTPKASTTKSQNTDISILQVPNPMKTQFKAQLEESTEASRDDDEFSLEIGQKFKVGSPVIPVAIKLHRTSIVSPSKEDYSQLAVETTSQSSVSAISPVIVLPPVQTGPVVKIKGVSKSIAIKGLRGINTGLNESSQQQTSKPKNPTEWPNVLYKSNGVNIGNNAYIECDNCTNTCTNCTINCTNCTNICTNCQIQCDRCANTGFNISVTNSNYVSNNAQNLTVKNSTYCLNEFTIGAVESCNFCTNRCENCSITCTNCATTCKNCIFLQGQGSNSYRLGGDQINNCQEKCGKGFSCKTDFSGDGTCGEDLYFIQRSSPEGYNSLLCLDFVCRCGATTENNTGKCPPAITQEQFLRAVSAESLFIGDSKGLPALQKAAQTLNLEANKPRTGAPVSLVTPPISAVPSKPILRASLSKARTTYKPQTVVKTTRYTRSTFKSQSMYKPSPKSTSTLYQNVPSRKTAEYLPQNPNQYAPKRVIVGESQVAQKQTGSKVSVLKQSSSSALYSSSSFSSSQQQSNSIKQSEIRIQSAEAAKQRTNSQQGQRLQKNDDCMECKDYQICVSGRCRRRCNQPQRINCNYYQYNNNEPQKQIVTGSNRCAVTMGGRIVSVRQGHECDSSVSGEQVLYYYTLSCSQVVQYRLCPTSQQCEQQVCRNLV